MKNSRLLLIGLAIALTSPTIGAAQAAPTAVGTPKISALVQSILSAHPQGGRALSQAIQQLLISHPALAPDVVAAANAAKNPAVAHAVAVGFANALVTLQNSGSPGVGSLVAAEQSFSPSLQAAVSVAQAQALSFASNPGRAGPPPAILNSGVGPASPN